MKRLAGTISVWLLYIIGSQAANERINQEGRILGPPPAVSAPILFNTSNADSVVSAMQIFPVTNPWNEDISRRPLLANSDAMISQITNSLPPSHWTLVPEFEMNFVLVPDNQPRVPIYFFNYPDESDLDGGTTPYGLYPIPANLPIEGWPFPNTNNLMEWQTNDDGSDRHAIMVEPGAGYIWETWETAWIGATNWQASNGAKFNLNTNGLRRDTWTSGDAGGLPMFSALVRFDEAERGMVEHACRLVVGQSRAAHIYPATHNTGSTSDPNYPSMGQRVRLKSAFTIPSGWTREEQAVLMGLKKYGAIVADNGSEFSISVTPDNRWPANCFNHLRSVGITNFEVIQTTSTNEGPRSAGAPSAFAGPDQLIPPGQSAQLAGAVNWSNLPPAILLKQYSGPGTVTFGNAALTNTTAAFTSPGTYVLELSADDGVHAVAYDATVVTVSDVVNLSIGLSGSNVNLSWTGGTAPFVVQKADTLQEGVWSDVVTTSVQSVSIAATNVTGFFRIKANQP